MNNHIVCDELETSRDRERFKGIYMSSIDILFDRERKQT